MVATRVIQGGLLGNTSVTIVTTRVIQGGLLGNTSVYYVVYLQEQVKCHVYSTGV